MRDFPRIVVCGALLVLAALPGCTRSEASARPRAIVLVTIDTLRSDRLPAYGYAAGRTPRIDAFRRDAILFRDAWSQSPLTLPSHATLFTGLEPAGHGIRDNVGFELAAGAPTLAEALRDSGYATGAAVSAWVLRKEAGLARGFDFYDDAMPPAAGEDAIGYIQRDGAATLDAALGWIDQVRAEPFFLFLHLYEPHTPYAPPARYAALPPYDGEIAYADELFGRLVDELRQRGLYDDALVVLLSDHGEGLGDHGEDEHGIFLYRETLQVPLLVKLPRSERGGTSADRPVGLLDLAPTLLEAAGAEPLAAPGLSLFAEEAPGERSLFAETWVPRFHYGWSELHSVVREGLHYIHAPSPELYDLDSDPAETTNVLAQHRRAYAALRAEVESRLAAAPDPAAIDPEQAARLAALGYLGGGGTATGPLPDPKERIAGFPAIKRAFTLLREEDYPALVEAAREVREANPKMPDAWFMSIRAAAKTGRSDLALGFLADGLRALPGNTKLAIEGANLYLDLGRPVDAERHAELAVEHDPAQAWEVIARARLLAGAAAGAAEAIERSLDVRGENPIALVTRARIRRAQNDLPSALADLDHAADLVSRGVHSPIRTLHFHRADVLYRLGRTAEAEAAFREEIRLFPEHAEPYLSLAAMYLEQGRGGDATRAVYTLVDAAPAPESYLGVIRLLGAIRDERGVAFWTARARERFPQDPRFERAAAREGG